MKQLNIFLGLLVFLSSLCYGATPYPDANPFGASNHLKLDNDVADFIGSTQNSNSNCNFNNSDTPFGSGYSLACNGAANTYLATSLRMLANQDHTICFWLKSDNVADNDYIFGVDSIPDGDHAYKSEIDVDNYLSFAVYSGAANKCVIRDGNYTWYQDDKWHSFCFRINQSGVGSNCGYMAVFVDGELHPITGTALNQNMAASMPGAIWFLSVNSGAGGTADAKIDDITVFNDTALTDAQIKTMGLGNWTAEGTANSSTVDILIQNRTSLNYLAVLDESENFFIMANFTDDADGSAITKELGGTCNSTLLNAIIEEEATSSGFELCLSGCDNKTYSQEANFHTNLSYYRDFIRVEACHQQIAQQSLQANISCGGNVYSENILPQQIPFCSDGYGEVFIYSSVCSNYDNVNFSISFSGGVQRRKLINELELDREYFTHYDNLSFNTTTNLWQTNHTYEFYAHGSKKIEVNCSSTADVNFNNTVSENFTIVNRLPIINFLSVNTSLELLNLTSEVLIEYASGIWNFIISISDDDLHNINYSFFNNTGGLVYSTNSSKPIILNTSDGLFANFVDGNPFNLTVNATDTKGNSTEVDLLFNVTDTLNPTYTGFDNTSVTINSFHTWNATLSDEYLWSFNIMCDNGHNDSVTEIAATSFSYTNFTNITSDTVCNFNISDGHTALSINDIAFTKNLVDNKLIFDDIELTLEQEIKDFSFTKQVDRYNFCIEPTEKVLHLDIQIPESCIKYPSEDYKGWYVCKNKYWLDFESDYKVDSYYDRVTIDLSKVDDKIICFNSIGELNTVSGSQLIQATAVPNVYDEKLIEHTNWFNLDAITTTTTAGVLMYFFIFIILVGMLIYSEFTKIPALFVLTAIIWFFFAILIFALISAVIGILLIVLSLFIGIRGFMFA